MRGNPKSIPRILAVGLALVVSACSARRDAESKLAEVGIPRLREQAALLYKNAFAGTAPAFATVKSEDWPATFRALNPSHVGAYRDGFTLALERRDGVESGLYVIPQHMDV